MKRAYLNKAEALELLMELEEDVKVTGLSITAKREHSWLQKDFGKKGPGHAGHELVHISEVPPKDHETALKGLPFGD